MISKNMIFKRFIEPDLRLIVKVFENFYYDLKYTKCAVL